MRLGNRRKNIKGVTYFECGHNYLGPTVLAKTQVVLQLKYFAEVLITGLTVKNHKK